MQSTGIQCLNRDLGTGALLLGRNHEIGDGFNVSRCQTGVQIGTPGIDGNDITIHDSVLNDNGTAIKLVRGQRNFFQANSIYNNDRNSDSIFAGDEGILILNRANGGLTIPVIEFPSYEQRSNTLRGALGYNALDFNCQSPPSEWSLTATLQLYVPNPNGSAEIFLTTLPPHLMSPYSRTSIYSKGESFLNRPIALLQMLQMLAKQHLPIALLK